MIGNFFKLEKNIQKNNKKNSEVYMIPLFYDKLGVEGTIFELLYSGAKIKRNQELCVRDFEYQTFVLI